MAKPYYNENLNKFIASIRNDTVVNLLDKLFPYIPEKITYTQVANALGISRQAMNKYIRQWKARKQQEANHAA